MRQATAIKNKKSASVELSATDRRIKSTSPPAPMGQSIAILLLLLSLSVAFYGGFILLRWPIESYFLAFITFAASVLLGSVFFISKELRSRELTSDVVILSWLYVPLSFVIPFFIQRTNLISSNVIALNLRPLFTWSPQIWGGSFVVIALMLTIASRLIPKSDRLVKNGNSRKSRVSQK